MTAHRRHRRHDR